MTHIYIKPSSNQRSTTSRVASAAGRLRPNALSGKVDFPSFRLRSIRQVKCNQSTQARSSILIRPHSYLVLTTVRWHLHTCDDDLDLGRAAVDEEFDAVDET